MVHCFFDICISSSSSLSFSKYTTQKVGYERTVSILSQNAANHGLPSKPEELNSEQREILQRLGVSSSKGNWLSSAFSSLKKGTGSNLVFEAPQAPLAGRIVFSLYEEAELEQLRENFVKLCTGELGMCKSAPKKRLWYKGVRIHRIVKDFCVQGGDLTKENGLGGEVCAIFSSYNLSLNLYYIVDIRRKVSFLSGCPFRSSEIGLSCNGQCRTQLW